MSTTGNGTYIVKAPDSGSLSVQPTAEGATLIVVYCSPSSPKTDIVIYEGIQTQISGSTTQTVTGFDAAAAVSCFNLAPPGEVYWMTAMIRPIARCLLALAVASWLDGYDAVETSSS